MLNIPNNLINELTLFRLKLATARTPIHLFQKKITNFKDNLTYLKMKL